MTHRIFVSYASDNRFHEPNRKLFDRFLDDLITEIDQSDGTIPRDEIAFFAPRQIETGHQWPAELADALRTSRLLLAFYSPYYFVSRWCGREVQVFLDRQAEWAKQVGLDRPAQVIIPVLWMPCEPKIPSSISHLQFTDDRFPSEYRKRGVRRLMALALETEYEETKAALAERILQALAEPPMPHGGPLGPMETLPAAFASAAPPSAAADAAQPSARAAYFVFAAPRRQELEGIRKTLDPWGSTGWHWNPFHPVTDKCVGAMAQQAAGNKNLPFVALPCDDTLEEQLKRTRKLQSPVVIVTDPWSVTIQSYRRVLEDYDGLMLLNCAVLVPWNDDDPETREQQATLETLLRQTCRQKIAARVPGHYWSIRSAHEFTSRLLTILDEITLRLVDAAGPADLRAATSATLEKTATEQGISTTGPSQLVNTAADQSMAP
ncbi:MAG: FxsC protein [Acidobacteriota bacterium]